MIKERKERESTFAQQQGDIGFGGNRSSLLPVKVNSSFRIWITTRQVPFLPISVLQSSIKVTLESVINLKSCMRLSLQHLPLDEEKFWHKNFRMTLWSENGTIKYTVVHVSRYHSRAASMERQVGVAITT